MDNYIQANTYFGTIVFTCLSFMKLYLSFPSLGRLKAFYQSSSRNKVAFQDIMNVSPNILAKNWNFKTLRCDFLNERTLITTTLISFCHSKTLVPFCLWKKRPENAFLTLIVNYPKITQKNKLYHPKQQ